MPTWVQALLWVIGTFGVLGLIALTLIIYNKSGGFRLPGQHGARAAAAAVTDAVRERFEKNRMALAMFCGFIFGILLFSWMFPNFARWYVVQGGPVWLLFAGIVVIGIMHMTISKEKWRSGVVSFLSFVLLFGVGWHVILALCYQDNATHVATVYLAPPPSQQHAGMLPTIAGAIMPQQSACNIPQRNYTFSRDWTEFNPGGKCATRFVFPAGACVMYKQAGTGFVDGPFGDCPGSKGAWGIVDAQFVKSVGEPFETLLAISQPVHTQVFRQ